MGSNRQRAWRLAVVVATLAVIGLAAIAPAATAAPSSKSQNPDVNPGTVYRGRTVAFSISITNLSSSGQITAQGIRVAVPAGMSTGDIVGVSAPSPGLLTSTLTTFAGATPYVEILSANVLRNKTYTFTVTARIPCDEAATTYRWVTDVRQSNDFSGTGNEIPATDVPVTTVGDGGCSLAFTAQPKSTSTSTKITDTAFDINGGPVKVAVQSAGQSPAVVDWYTGNVTIATVPTTTLLGTLTRGLSAGEATFDDLSIAAAGPYVLRASIGTLSGDSSSFTIYSGTTVTCTAGGSPLCTTGDFTGSSSTTGNIVVNDNDSLDAILQAAFVPPSIDCAGYDEFGDQIYFNITDSSGQPITSGNLTKTVTVTKPTPSGRPHDTGLDEWRYQFCFQSQTKFQALPYTNDAQGNFNNMLKVAAGDPFTVDAEPVPAAQNVLGTAQEWRGLLPLCTLVGDQVPCLDGLPTFDNDANPPTVTFVANVPAADPMGR